MKKNILTYEGLKQYEDELEELKVIKRKEVVLSPTSPSKLVVPILGCTVNHPGHLFKNPSALVAHRTNSIRMSGARSQASAFEKNPK